MILLAVLLGQAAPPMKFLEILALHVTHLCACMGNVRSAIIRSTLLKANALITGERFLGLGHLPTGCA